jgi:hypothetical protein
LFSFLFHFIDGFLCCADVFGFSFMQSICLFRHFLLVLWVLYLQNHCQSQYVYKLKREAWEEAKEANPVVILILDFCFSEL